MEEIEIIFPKQPRREEKWESVICPTCGCTKKILNVYGAPLKCGYQNAVCKDGQIFSKPCRGWKD